eukprot:m.120842 g.120842  ORF g.120842 m.120842 type:complete len:982 (+) comp28833_c0_seq3:239-3184(+)
MSRPAQNRNQQHKSFKRQETFKELTIGTLHRIRYTKTGKDLGFTIVGGVDYAYGGIYVETVANDDKSGLFVGDRILSINNMGLLCIVKEEADNLFAQVPSDFLILVLRLGRMQWNLLHGKAAGKGQMRLPGPFFKPYCRGANLPLMDGVHSTHGEVEHFKLPASKGALGLRLMCFGRAGLVPNSKETGCMFISEINPQGLAHQMPGIQVGARLLEINGHCLLSSSQNIFAYRVKQCHIEQQPIELVLQFIDPSQWHGLKKALASIGNNADKSSLSRNISDSERVMMAGTSAPVPRQSLTASELSQRKLSVPKAAGLKRTPSVQERQMLLDKQRGLSAASARAPDGAQQKQPSAPVTPTSRDDTSDTLTRARPSEADKRALLNMQMSSTPAVSGTKPPPPQQQQQQFQQAPVVKTNSKSRPSQAEKMALMKSQRGGPGVEESSTASLMKQMGELSVTEQAMMSDDSDATDVVGGFDGVVRDQSEFEDVVIDEDEDGNPFLEMQEKDSDITERKMTLEPFDLAKYEALSQRLALSSQMPPGVKHLNRYINILPTIKTRVKLPQIGKDATTTYINANYIGSFDDKNLKAYILCQAPTPTMRGAADFWRMAWECKTKVIIMATGISEGGVEKCVRYWPSRLYDAKNKVGEGVYQVQSIPGYPSISVKVTDGFRKDGYITSKFTVQQQGQPAREMRHYWFDSWPDHGVPERTEPLIAMVKAARTYTEGSKSPWLVHCSAGIGRSGTVVAVDWGLHQLQQTGSANVVSIVDRLRHFRGGLVQHGEQANFIQLCLSRFVEAQGSIVVLSVMEEEVLEESIDKALQMVPDEMGVHHSQVDGDEGSESEIPKWRAQQINKIKSFQEAGLREEIEDLQSSGQKDIADRRAKREDAKQKEKMKSAENAMSKMNELLDLRAKTIFTEQPKSSSRMATLKKPGFNKKRTSVVVNAYQAANQRHGSIHCGKMNAQQYATLDGDFHLDSSMAGVME